MDEVSLVEILTVIGRILLLFVEVFFVFLTVLFMMGAMMETVYAAVGIGIAGSGLVYAYMHREKLDLIDRYFYYILGLFVTYGIAFFMTR